MKLDYLINQTMDLGFDLDKGPNGEGAAADRYAVFYRNGDFPNCGTLT